MSAPLLGRGVLVTRPAQQAERLALRLRELGAQAICFPLIDILALDDVAPLQALAEQLATFDLAFFVSSNAVAHALAVLPRAQWPSTLQVATVGPGTARMLHEAGFANVLVPRTQHDSEGVLALPEFSAAALAGKRLLILRGDGGRELLADTARARGAEVAQISCYRRVLPQADPAPLLAEFAAGRVHAISLSSSEAANNFVALLGEQARAMLQALPVFVPHTRIAQRVDALGARHVMLTDAGDEGLLRALVAFFAARDGSSAA